MTTAAPRKSKHILDLSANDAALFDMYAAQAMRLGYEYWMRDFHQQEAHKGEAKHDFASVMSFIAEDAFQMAFVMLKTRVRYTSVPLPTEAKGS